MSGSAVSNVVPNTSFMYKNTLMYCGPSIQSVLDANPRGLCSAVKWTHMVSEVKGKENAVVLTLEGRYHNCDAYYHWMLEQEKSGFRGILDMKKFKYSKEDGTCEDSPVQYPMRDPMRASTLPKLIEDVVRYVLFHESMILHEQVMYNRSYLSQVKIPTKFAPNVVPEQKPIIPREGDQLHELKSALAKSQRERDDIRGAFKTQEADLKRLSKHLESSHAENGRLGAELEASQAINVLLRKELDALENNNKRLREELEASEEKNKALETHTDGYKMVLCWSVGHMNRIRELEVMVNEQNTIIGEQNAMIRQMRGAP